MKVTYIFNFQLRIEFYNFLKFEIFIKFWLKFHYFSDVYLHEDLKFINNDSFFYEFKIFYVLKTKFLVRGRWFLVRGRIYAPVSSRAPKLEFLKIRKKIKPVFFGDSSRKISNLLETCRNRPDRTVSQSFSKIFNFSLRTPKKNRFWFWVLILGFLKPKKCVF